MSKSGNDITGRRVLNYGLHCIRLSINWNIVADLQGILKRVFEQGNCEYDVVFYFIWSLFF